MDQVVDEIEQRQRDGGRANHQSETLHVIKRFQAEREDSLFCPPDILQKVVGSVPEHALRPRIRYAYLLESDPGTKTTDENIVFAETQQMFDRLAIDQREVAGIDGNVNVGEVFEDTVKRLVKDLHIP